MIKMFLIDLGYTFGMTCIEGEKVIIGELDFNFMQNHLLEKF